MSGAATTRATTGYILGWDVTSRTGDGLTVASDAGAVSMVAMALMQLDGEFPDAGTMWSTPLCTGLAGSAERRAARGGVSHTNRTLAIRRSRDKRFSDL